jgi:hypothetical protein
MRVFAFGLLLVACSGGSVAEERAPHQPASAGGDGAGAGGAITSSRAGEGGRAQAGATAVSSAGAGGAYAAGASGFGSAGAVTGSGGAAGTAGAGLAGSAGSAAGGGSGGPDVDPLAPFPAPGCADYTEYRVPKGKYLAVTGQGPTIQSADVTPTTCTVLAGAPVYVGCATVSNVDQCECPGPEVCDHPHCDGPYVLAALKAKPGGTFVAELRDGAGSCKNGVPVKQ